MYTEQVRSGPSSGKTDVASDAGEATQTKEYISAKEDQAKRLGKAIAIARAAFPDLDKIQSERASIPILHELLEYREKLVERLNLAATDKGLDPERADKLLKLLEPEDLKQGLGALMQKLRTETDYLRELEDTLIAQALPEGVDKAKYGAAVKFVDPNSTVGEYFSKKGGRGLYVGIVDFAVIFCEAPTQREIWQTLATTGALPASITYLDHELTHDTQVTKGQRALLWLFMGSSLAVDCVGFSQLGFLRWIGLNSLIKPARTKLVQTLTIDSGLMETHAFEAASASPTVNMRTHDERDEIVNAVTNYPGVKISSEQAKLAYGLIRSLRLLGLNDREIGPIISKEKYDRKRGTYPLLAARLNEERAKHNLNDDNVFALVREALEARHQVELLAQRAQARILASKALVTVVSKSVREES